SANSFGPTSAGVKAPRARASRAGQEQRDLREQGLEALLARPGVQIELVDDEEVAARGEGPAEARLEAHELVEVAPARVEVEPEVRREADGQAAVDQADVEAAVAVAALDRDALRVVVAAA